MYYEGRGEIALRMGAPQANRLLLAIEAIDEHTPGLDPALEDLREQLRAALARKSSGDTDSAPSTE
ncbi:MAG: hypothetical protein ACXWNK_11025 [Vulcanimicrobiaceae bacterium]